MPVLAADTNLPGVLEVPVIAGRWFDTADIEGASRPAVIGTGLAQQYGYLPGEIRTIRLNGVDFGVVGVLGNGRPRPGARQRGLHHPVGRRRERLRHRGQADQALHPDARTAPRRGRRRSIPTAISLGGTDEVTVEVPSDALEGRGAGRQDAAADRALRRPARARGRRSRHRERDVDLRHPAFVRDRHPPRSSATPAATIGAQFLLEALFVGLLGGLVGAGLGVSS